MHLIQLRRKHHEQLWEKAVQASAIGWKPAPDPADLRTSRRRNVRTALVLKGRYMLGDGAEYPCETTDLSPTGVGIRGFAPATIGSKVVAYIDGLGRVEGKIVRRLPGWFALSLKDYFGKEDRLSSRIEYLVSGASTERRRAQRIEQHNVPVVLRDADGNELKGELLDISVDGASIAIEKELAVSQRVWVDDHAAKVVRVTPLGIAVKFV